MGRQKFTSEDFWNSAHGASFEQFGDNSWTRTPLSGEKVCDRRPAVLHQPITLFVELTFDSFPQPTGTYSEPATEVRPLLS
jgi:hypothetical protein